MGLFLTHIHYPQWKILSLNSYQVTADLLTAQPAQAMVKKTENQFPQP